MITKFDMNCDTVYGIKKTMSRGLLPGERIKMQYCEDGSSDWPYKTRWDVMSSRKKEDGKTEFLVAAPGFVTGVTLSDRQITDRVRKIITTHREYTVDEYRHCRCDEGWNGFLRGKEFICGVSYIDQLASGKTF